jgi:hypothetical protein
MWVERMVKVNEGGPLRTWTRAKYQKEGVGEIVLVKTA